MSTIAIEGRTVYVCEICKTGYADIPIAKECEDFCKTHNACSLEITRRAIHRIT